MEITKAIFVLLLYRIEWNYKVHSFIPNQHEPVRFRFHPRLYIIYPLLTIFSPLIVLLIGLKGLFAEFVSVRAIQSFTSYTLARKNLFKAAMKF